MKNQELIEILKKADPNGEVFLVAPGITTGCSPVGEAMCVNGDVFIEHIEITEAIDIFAKDVKKLINEKVNGPQYGKLRIVK